MIEDKLTRDERIRLECLAQAITHRAKHFEYYIRGEEENPDASR